jgi:hypothetical protein
MAREISTTRALQRIAAELGVPAMQKAVASLLEAFAAVDDPERCRDCVALLSTETKRLRGLPEGSECPSSDDLRRLEALRNGGSGPPGLRG